MNLTAFGMSHQFHKLHFNKEKYQPLWTLNVQFLWGLAQSLRCKTSVSYASVRPSGTPGDYGGNAHKQDQDTVIPQHYRHTDAYLCGTVQPIYIWRLYWQIDWRNKSIRQIKVSEMCNLFTASYSNNQQLIWTESPTWLAASFLDGSSPRNTWLAPRRHRSPTVSISKNVGVSTDDFKNCMT